MYRQDLNESWEFYESNESMSFVFHRPKGEEVDLPHDFIITKPRAAHFSGGAANAYFDEGQGVYRKRLEEVQGWEGKTVLLDIDGAYMNAEVALNGELLGIHPYGYTPYQVELTKALRFDGRRNELKIITQSRQPSTRWYSGGGLYRSVCLWIGAKLHIKPWDVFVTTPDISEHAAAVQFDVTVTNDHPQDQPALLLLEVLDGEGQVVAGRSLEITAAAQKQWRGCETVTVENPNLWDMDSPYLYTYRVTVSGSQGQKDVAEDQFGIRSISVDPVNGFRLNGRTIKLKGGCLHHDNAFLGACAYPQAEERKIRLLQSVGYNAVRISHYPPSLALLRVCDRLGMLLLDECFDAWRIGKMPLDYHIYFEDWWERDIELMVKRDRNHPCVITYSIGNEIGERDGKNDGALWSARLTEKVKSLDDTRFVLSAICGVFQDDVDEGSNFEANLMDDKDDYWGRATAGYAEPLDIVGYNYLYKRYEQDHETFPDRVIVGAETHSFNTYDYWEATMKNDHVIGDFIWTAADYLGEVGVGKVYWDKSGEPMNFMTPYPWRTSWQSDLLLTGKRRPQSYYREIMWENTKETFLFTTHPEHYGDNFKGTGWHWYDVNDSWTFEKRYLGKMVQVDAYGPGDEAEFIINGRSLGRVPYEKLIASMDIPYEEGTIEAVSYLDGMEISRGNLRTAAEARMLSLQPELDKAAAGDLLYIHVELVDESGIHLPEDESLVDVKISGPAKFLAMGSGSPCSEDQIGAQQCHLYHGAAVVILMAEGDGAVEVKAVSEKGISGSCRILVKNSEG